jgi:phosphoglycerol transferase MdoB-like AlkP superfamily enzyme
MHTTSIQAVTKHSLFQPSNISESFWEKLRPTGAYAPLVAMLIIGLPILSLSRISLILWQADRVTATGLLQDVLLQGVRVDLILLSLFALIPLLLSPLFAIFKAWQQWRYFTFIWLVFVISFIIFLEAASPGFIAEYDTRPNRLFVEYLKYPQEVIPMLWNGFRVHVLAGIIAIVAAVWLMIQLAKPWVKQKNHFRLLPFLIALPLVLLLTILSIRSTLGHRPANPALFAITNDSMVNTLILNSPYSVLYAIYNLKHEKGSSKIYGKMSTKEMIAEFKNNRATYQDNNQLLNHAQFPTLSLQKPSRNRDKPLNIVIILEESLGATFVESLGGIPATPELEKLKNDGWWFEQLYATGTRSVRGIEAVVAGFAPTPARSVVKLSLAQNNFVTLASILSDQGYLTEFIYGGESHFDNMRGFFMGNGFQQVIDQKDYVNPSFVGSWGVSDEDLLNRTHEQLTKHHATGQPFFTLAFTSSNHSPFEYPDGRIKPYEAEKATENNAVKYTDFALGQFFKKAKTSEYYKDTIFLVVADHDIHVRGADLVPVTHFHIPGLILGADIKPKKIKTVASQIDLPTTLLSLAGIEVKSPMIGRDLSSEADNTPGRAMMQYNKNYAWMEGQELVVLRPDQVATFGHYDRTSKKVTVVAAPANANAQAKRALAHSLLPAWLYSNERYRNN